VKPTEVVFKYFFHIMIAACEHSHIAMIGRYVYYTIRFTVPDCQIFIL